MLAMRSVASKYKMMCLISSISAQFRGQPKVIKSDGALLIIKNFTNFLNRHSFYFILAQCYKNEPEKEIDNFAKP